ncbi:MAG: HNH endonuclease signature motif containing protein, partial [Ilumatobacter sp.]|uniref:HNH endonuclease signature motif containing protein n=1 Tax=Ilumatobacter sp. TaxID=1967498 RepID=UPI003C715DE6
KLEAEAAVESSDDDVEAKSAPTATAPVDEAWFGWDDNGRFRLHANLGHDTGSIIETALTNARDALFNAGVPDVDTIDALIEVAERSLDNIESPDRRSRYRVNFHITEHGDVTDQRHRPVTKPAADRITCDALVSPAKFVNGVPVSVGRSQHIVPDRTRRLVEHRDEGCRVPGCGSNRFVEVHHIIHWSQNGPTDTFNLICICPKHHRLHHQGRLGITGNADLDQQAAGGVVFTDKYGKILTESGARPWPPGAAPPPIQGTYEHPIGERLDFRWLHFANDPQERTKLDET